MLRDTRYTRDPLARAPCIPGRTRRPEYTGVRGIPETWVCSRPGARAHDMDMVTKWPPTSSTADRAWPRPGSSPKLIGVKLGRTLAEIRQPLLPGTSGRCRMRGSTRLRDRKISIYSGPPGVRRIIVPGVLSSRTAHVAMLRHGGRRGGLARNKTPEISLSGTLYMEMFPSHEGGRTGDHAELAAVSGKALPRRCADDVLL
jgi:hypothetical protein